MPAQNISAAQYSANNAKVAGQAAEAALCHYAYINGLRLDDESFDHEKASLAAVIERRLEGIWDRVIYGD